MSDVGQGEDVVGNAGLKFQAHEKDTWPWLLPVSEAVWRLGMSRMQPEEPSHCRPGSDVIPIRHWH